MTHDIATCYVFVVDSSGEIIFVTGFGKMYIASYQLNFLLIQEFIKSGGNRYKICRNDRGMIALITPTNIKFMYLQSIIIYIDVCHMHVFTNHIKK